MVALDSSLGFSLGSYVLFLAMLGGNAVLVNRGHFEYILDDVYIHVSMARNLATTGIYGVAAGTYESASSPHPEPGCWPSAGRSGP